MVNGHIKPGKRSKAWLKIRKQWIANNPPTHEGAYICSICGKPVHESQLELDHIAGRSGELLSDESNLAPSHRYCNQRKGSQKWEPKISSAEYQLRKDLKL